MVNWTCVQRKVLSSTNYWVVRYIIFESLMSIVKKCIQPNPDERYQTVLDLVADLTDWISGSERRRKAKQYLLEVTAIKKN